MKRRSAKISKWESEESKIYKRVAESLDGKTESDWERRFIDNILTTDSELSEPQMTKLEELAEEYLE